MRIIVWGVFVGILGITGCSSSETPKKELVSEQASEQKIPENESSPVTNDSKASEAQVNENLKKLTLTQFIENSKPMMTDTYNEHPQAAAMLAYYMDLTRVKLSDIEQIPATTKGKILKDSQTEKGKRICVNGSIVEISVDRSGGFPAYTGVMVDNSLQAFAFIAIGSTGDIVAQSNAKFCGITVGKMRYSNSGGGESTAPYVVGLFDLPENK